MSDSPDPTAGLPDPSMLEQIREVLAKIYSLGQNIVSKGTESREVLNQLSSAGKGATEVFNKAEDAASKLFKEIVSGGQGAAAAIKAEVIIFNILGQKLRTLFTGTSIPGRNTVRWDGKDDAGHNASTGVYFFQLRTPTSVITSKMVMTR